MTLNSHAADAPTRPVFAVVVLFAAMLGFALLVMAGLSVWNAGTATAATPAPSVHALGILTHQLS